MAFGGAVGELFVTIGADVGPFDRGMGHVAQSMANTANNVQRQGNVITKAFSGIGSSVGSVINAFGRLGLAGMGIQTVAGAVQGLTAPFIGANAQMQNFENTLTTLYQTIAGSEEAAKRMGEETLAWAKKFANFTPFDTSEVVEATVRLQAYGLQAKDVLESTGNMASAMGKPLMQAVEAIADAQTGELERLKEFGITKKMLIDQALAMGKGEIVNAQGQITDMEALNEALFALMDARFKGGMERQSKGFEGMMSNLKAVFDELTLTIGAPIFERVSTSLQGFLDLIAEHQDTITAFGEAVGQGIGQAFDLVAGAVQAMLPPLQTAFDWVQKFFNYFQANNDFDLMGAMFGPDIGPKIDEVVRAIQGFLSTLGNLARLAGDVLGGKLDFGRWLDVSLQTLKPAAGKVGDAFGNLWRSIDWGAIWRQATNLVQSIMGWLRDQWAKINWLQVWQAAKDIGSSLASGLGDIAGKVGAWLGSEWAKINWGDVWARAKDIGASIAGNVGSIAGKVGSWIGTEWAKINWGDVWSQVKDIGGAIATSVASIAGKVGAWLGTEWAKIKWEDVWASVVGIGTAIATSVGSIVSNVTSWLSTTWSKIDWAAVWASVTGIGSAIATNIVSIYSNVTSWLSTTWSKIKWEDVWASVTGVGAAFEATAVPITTNVTSWLKQSFAAIDWPAVWGAAARMDVTMAAWLDQQDWGAMGRDLAKRVQDVFKGVFTVDVAMLLVLPFAAPQIIGKFLPIQTIWEINKGLWEMALNFGKSMVDGILDGLGDLAGVVGRKISDGLTGAIGAGDKAIERGSPSRVMIRMGEDMVAGLLNGLADLGREMGSKLSAEVSDGVGAMQKALDLGQLLRGGGTIAIVLINLGETMGKSITDGLLSEVAEIPETLTDNLAAAVGQSIGQAVPTITADVENDMQLALQGGFLRATEKLVDPIARDMELALAGGLLRAIEGIQNDVETGGLAEDVQQIGTAIQEGMAEGLSKVESLMGTTISGVIRAGIDTARNVLGIASPSKVMQAIGEQMIAGLTLGVDERGQAFMDRFLAIITEPVKWWQDEGLNIFDFMRAQAATYAREQANNLDYIWEEMKQGNKGIEDFVKVIDQMYGGLRNVLDPLTAIAGLLAAPVMAQFSGQIDDYTDRLQRLTGEYEYQRRVIADAMTQVSERYDVEIDRLDEVMAAVRERMALEQQPFMDANLKASAEYEALQKEINQQELAFARQREAAMGDKEKLKAIEDEERAYKAAQRFRLDVLRAEIQVAKDQMDSVEDRHAAELKAIEDQKAAAKDRMQSELDYWAQLKKAKEEAYDVEKWKLQENLKYIERQRDEAVKLDSTIQGVLGTINNIQSKLAETEWLKTIPLIANAFTSAGMQIPQAIWDALQRLPREVGGALDLVISQLMATYNRGLYGVPGYAAGTLFHPGGMALVGEKGPELLDLPTGSRVYPTDELTSVGFDYERMADVLAKRPSYVLNATYARFEDERSIMDDLKLMTILGSIT